MGAINNTYSNSKMSRSELVKRSKGLMTGAIKMSQYEMISRWVGRDVMDFVIGPYLSGGRALWLSRF